MNASAKCQTGVTCASGRVVEAPIKVKNRKDSAYPPFRSYRVNRTDYLWLRGVL
jgi:hypothetical protein